MRKSRKQIKFRISYAVAVAGVMVSLFAVSIRGQNPPATQLNAANQLFDLAETQRNEGDKSSLLESINNYLRAEVLYGELKAPKQRASSRNQAGHVYFLLGENEKAAASFAMAATISRTAGDSGGEAFALANLGSVRMAMGDNRVAIQIFGTALDIQKQLSDSLSAAITLNGLGVAHHNLGENDKAFRFFSEASSLLESGPMSREKADTLINLGTIAGVLGKASEAIKQIEEARLYYASARDFRGVATAMNNLGAIYAGLSKRSMARDHYRIALMLWPKSEYEEPDSDSKVGASEMKSRTDETRSQGSRNRNLLVLIRSKFGLRYDHAIELGYVRDFGLDRKTTTTSIDKSQYPPPGAPPKSNSNSPQVSPSPTPKPPSDQTRVGDLRGKSSTLVNIGEVLFDLGDSKGALTVLSSAQVIHAQTGEKRAESVALNNLGWVNFGLLKYEEATRQLERAATVARDIDDRSTETTVWNNLGVLAGALGYTKSATSKLEDARRWLTVLRDKSREAAVLNNLGLLLKDRGERRAALQNFELAIQMAREVGDKATEAALLSNRGLIESELGERKKALESYDEALKVFQDIKDRMGEATVLINRGAILSDLAELGEALSYYRTVLEILEALGDEFGAEETLRNRLATTLNNAGLIYNELGDYESAIDSLSRAKSLFLAAGNRLGYENALANIGIFYGERGDFTLAFYYLEMALTFKNNSEPFLDDQPTKGADDKHGKASIISNLGRLYAKQGDFKKAIEQFELALPLHRYEGGGDLEGEAATLSSLMFAWSQLKKPQLAILYGKQAVNTYQKLRGSIEGLSRRTQQAYGEKVAGSYRLLAGLLVEEGRFFEAEQVRAMLKEEEYAAYVSRDAEEIGKLSSQVVLLESEAAALKKYNEEVAGTVAESANRFLRLQQLKNEKHSGFDQKEYDKLKNILDTANAAFNLFFEKALKNELTKEKFDEIKWDKSLQGDLAEWDRISGERTVILNTISSEGLYRVLMTTPKFQVDGKYEIKASELNAKVDAFRAALKNSSVDPRPLGKQLYDILVGPIQKELAQADPTTILWSLDGALRYIPVAALSPDGNGYLVEKYRTAVINSDTRRGISASTDGRWRVIGAGVTSKSEVKDPVTGRPVVFPELPGVEREVDRIVLQEKEKSSDGILKGEQLLNEKFDAGTLGDLMSMRNGGAPSYNVVHLATHFRLSSTNQGSFLLVGGKDGNAALTLTDISSDTNLNFSTFELVTLSACETAFGSVRSWYQGGEVDSMATFIQDRGAKAVLASLWSVADESTSLLMTEFYRIKAANPNMTKAAALQKAQIAMISGALKADPNCSPKCTNRSGAKDLGGDGPVKFEYKPEAPYSHPYFWSPFVMMGNWR